MNETTPIRHAVGRTTHFIDGRWSEAGGRTFKNYNPYDGEVFAEVAAGGRAEARGRRRRRGRRLPGLGRHGAARPPDAVPQGRRRGRATHQETS